MNLSPKKMYRWKGRIVKKKVYSQRKSQSVAGTKRRKANEMPAIFQPQSPEKNDVGKLPRSCVDPPELPTIPEVFDSFSEEENLPKNCDDNSDLSASDVTKPGEGRRIVDLQCLAQFLKCVFCKTILSLENIEKETRRGLASTLYIRCHDCLLVNEVPTGEVLVKEDARSRVYPVNCKAVMGALHAGMGCNHLNKMLACLNIPTVNPKLFKRYERIVGPAIESVARTSCAEAVTLEKALTIQNTEDITKLL